MADLDAATEAELPYQEIREGVRKLCAQFPGEYWRHLDRERAYPAEFVKAVTAAGYLSALIPEEHGGSGLPLSAAGAILEEIQHAGCNGAACHAQMYIMGALLRHGSAEQKQKYLPAIATGRAAAPGVWGHRAVERHRHLIDLDLCSPRWRSLRRQWTENLDLALGAFRPDAAARTGRRRANRPRDEPHSGFPCSFSICGRQRPPACRSGQSAR